MNVPNHIAIILDGNGRWAKAKGLPRGYGHVKGCANLEQVCYDIKDLGVKYLTVYAFSTENWKRSQEEVSGIMTLLGRYLEEALRDMEKNRVHFVFFGDLSKLSPSLQELCRYAEFRSRDYHEVQVNFCLNYGGRDEIIQAARQFAEAVARGERAPSDLNEDLFSQYLYSAGVPDPELVIRPGGETRISNFLLWQSAYAEYYFTDVLWPDFGPEELDKAIDAFNARDRRFGGVK